MMTQTVEQELYRWIEASHLEYGGDPWCFLRELAQNSRDADATRIEVTSGTLDSGDEWISFCDNGKGMAWSSAQSFLLKLYASSKDEREDYAGTFGVGFWTVLLFAPSLILISSRTEDESWGLKIDQHLQINRQQCDLETRGTSITLIRERRFADAAEFRAAITDRVTYYCRFLTCRFSDRPLHTFCEGQRISSELTLGLPHEFRFKSRKLRGVVAITSSPKVELLVKGIPVWLGCSLNELKNLHNGAPSPSVTVGDFDQAPAFLIDARRLKVSFTRREVIHDKELNAIIGQAHKALSMHLEKQAARAFPPRLGQTIRHWFSLRRSRVLLLMLLMILILPLVLYTFNNWLHVPLQTVYNPSPTALSPSIYRGSIPDQATARPVLPYRLTYSPPVPLYLRWFTAGRFDEKKGWQYSPDQPDMHFEQRNDLDLTARITITLQQFSAERFPVLLPALTRNFRLFSASPHPLLPRPVISQDNVYFDLPAGLTKIIYQVDEPAPAASPDTVPEFWLQCPGIDTWPQSWQTMIIQGRKASELDRIYLVQRIMTANFFYQAGQKQPGKAISDAGASWLERVLEAGMGDCDLINGFAVLLLRNLGIPARLVIGWQGRDGSLTDELHAWGEALVNGNWMILDYISLLPQWPRSKLPMADITPLGQYIIPLSLIVAGVLILSVLIVLLKSRFSTVTRTIPHPAAIAESPDSIRLRLIQSARSAVLHPRLWGSQNAIWDLRLLPSIPDPISLREAVSAFNKGRLMVITDPDQPPSPLVRPLTKNRFIRICNSPTDEICRLLPKNLDLTELSWHAANLPQDPLIEELNRLLQKDRWGRWKIVETDCLVRNEALRWFDLRAIHGAASAYGSNRLILISKSIHPPFADGLDAWDWICAHHSGLSLHTIRRITHKLLKKDR